MRLAATPGSARRTYVKTATAGSIVTGLAQRVAAHARQRPAEARCSGWRARMSPSEAFSIVETSARSLSPCSRSAAATRSS